MTDWTSETELATDARMSTRSSWTSSTVYTDLGLCSTGAFTKILFTFFGIYVWELFQTSDFEISILLGRRKLQWPMGTF